MDIEELKETLGEERYTALAAHVADLEGQRDAARNESIKHRQGLKTKVAELEKTNTELTRSRDEMLERLGVDSLEALADLDPKGQAEAAKQFEVKLKRLEKELSDKTAAYGELDARYRGSLKSSAMQQALAGHDWVDRELVTAFVSQRLDWDEDQVVFKTNDGGLVPLDDGIKTLTKERPHLLKSAGAGGSGYRGGQSANGEAKTKNPWAKESRNITEQIALMRDDPARAEQLKAAAGVS